MPASSRALKRPDLVSDGILTRRLRTLGYSLAVPEPPRKTQIEILNEQIEEYERQHSPKKRRAKEREVEQTPAKEPPPHQHRVLPEKDADFSLEDFVFLARSHKQAAIAAKVAVQAEKEEKRRAKVKGKVGAVSPLRDAQLPPPPSTPTKKMKTMNLSSVGVPGQSTSPRKRSRRPSSEIAWSARSPSTDPSIASSDLPPWSPQSPSPRKVSTSPSKTRSPSSKKTSPRKAEKRFVPGFGHYSIAAATAILTGARAMSTPSPSSPFPLVETITRLCEEIPSLQTLPDLVHLAQALSPASSLLDTAATRAETNSRIFGPSLSFVSRNLFSSTSSPPKNAPLATFLLSRALNLYPCPSTTSEPVVSPSPSQVRPRFLSTRHTHCIQCASALVLRNRKEIASAFLAATASPAVPVVAAIHRCSFDGCRAVHAVDHVEIEYEGQRVWIWDDQAPAYKVGERVWLDRGLIEHARASLLEQSVSAGGYADLWNGLYSPAATSSSVGVAEEESSTSDEEEENREDESDDGYASPTPCAPRQRAKQKAAARAKRHSKPFALHARHIWRGIVLLSSFHAISTSSASASSPASVSIPFFVSSPRASTRRLVALANAGLFSSSAVGATVLPPHSCETCSRERRRWRGTNATEEEREEGIRWAGAHDEEFAEDVSLAAGPPVSLAVCDGVQIGHVLCAVPSCPNPPERHRRARRFCTAHLSYHTLCGFVGCDLPRADEDDYDREEGDDDDEPTEACYIGAHQELWRRFRKRTKGRREMGWAGRKKGSGEKGEKYEVLGVDESEEGEGETEDDGSDVESEKRASQAEGKRVSTMWSLRRTTTLQILVGACGVPLAWTKFVDRESTSEVVSFLSSAHSQLFVPPTPHSLKTSFPSYIAYDKACTILRSLLPDDATSSSGSFTLPTFLNTTRLVVTAFHRGCHPANDAFCDEFCDPTPLSGEGRHNLVVPFQRPKERGVMESKAERKKRKVRTFERAFNTTAAEQLNSTISRFAPLLSTMRADNFDFLVSVLLRHRREKAGKRTK